MLELVEESLNTISEFVGLRVVRNLDFAVPFGGNNDLGICLFDHLAQGVGVVGFVGDDTAGRQAVQKVSRGGDVMRLAAGQDEA